MNDEDLRPLQIDLVASNSHDVETNGVRHTDEQESQPPDQQIDLKVQNVVTMFSCCCHIDLRKLALSSCHVMYERNKGVSKQKIPVALSNSFSELFFISQVLVKQMKNPKCYVRIWSSGKITVAGCRRQLHLKKVPFYA